MKIGKYGCQVILIMSVVVAGAAFSAEAGVFANISKKATVEEHGVKEISYDQFAKLRKSGEPFVLINALPRESFIKGHIEGSINMPIEKVGFKRAESKIGAKTTNVVVYCANFKCHASTNVAQALMGLGYINVVDYKGGIKEWQAKGNELVV